jgi:hypothetical protein
MKTALLVLAVLLMGTSASGQDRTSPPYVSVDWVALSTAAQWQRADAVVLLRINDRVIWGHQPGLNVLHHASVLRVVKTHPVGGPTGQAIRFVQSGSTDEPPYLKGDEFIAFLTWSVPHATFVRLAGPQSLCAISEGMVTWVNEPEPTLAHLGEMPPPMREMMKVEDFIARLRALTKARR